MAITHTTVKSDGVNALATGRFLDDASSPAAATITIGFKPRYVRFVNLTDRIQFEWFEGMANDSALKQVAAGTGTLETSGGLTVSSAGFTVAAGILIQNKQYTYVAQR